MLLPVLCILWSCLYGMVDHHHFPNNIVVTTIDISCNSWLYITYLNMVFTPYGYPGSNDYGSLEVHWKMLSVDRQIPRH